MTFALSRFQMGQIVHAVSKAILKASQCRKKHEQFCTLTLTQAQHITSILAHTQRVKNAYYYQFVSVFECVGETLQRRISPVTRAHQAEIVYMDIT